VKPVTKITFYDDAGEKFFGEGPARLLRGIEETGSLSAAAKAMGMAYTKALKLIRNAENALGFQLTSRTVGGRDGGGSILTPEAKIWLRRYEAYRDACKEANRRLFAGYFPSVACVIMASGMSRRFGSNKLLTEFDGVPLILRALQVTENLFDRRIVVTRHPEVAELCRQHGADVLLHDLPDRSDTVRLGLEAVGEADACLFLPADQPLLRKETVAGLVSRWENDREQIFRPVCKEMPGSPVLFPRWAFPELMTLPEGKGGSVIMKKHPERVTPVEIEDPFELMDADTPEALDELLRHKNNQGA